MKGGDKECQEGDVKSPVFHAFITSKHTHILCLSMCVCVVNGFIKCISNTVATMILVM